MNCKLNVWDFLNDWITIQLAQHVKGVDIFKLTFAQFIHTHSFNLFRTLRFVSIFDTFGAAVRIIRIAGILDLIKKFRFFFSLLFLHFLVWKIKKHTKKIHLRRKNDQVC